MSPCAGMLPHLPRGVGGTEQGGTGGHLTEKGEAGCLCEEGLEGHCGRCWSLLPKVARRQAREEAPGAACLYLPALGKQ